MMISWVAPVHPSHPYLENDPAPSFAPTICAFHLGFSLEDPDHLTALSKNLQTTNRAEGKAIHTVIRNSCGCIIGRPCPPTPI